MTDQQVINDSQSIVIIFEFITKARVVVGFTSSLVDFSQQLLNEIRQLCVNTISVRLIRLLLCLFLVFMCQQSILALAEESVELTASESGPCATNVDGVGANLKVAGDKLQAQAVAAQEEFHYPQALALLEQVLTCRLHSHDMTGEATAKFYMGKSLWWLGRNQEAMERYQEALAIRKKYGKPLEVANVLYYMGLNERYLGLHASSLQHYQEALDIAGKQDNLLLQVFCKADMASLYSFQGEYDKALKLAESAMVLAKNANNLKAESQAEFHLGGVYRSIGSTEKALKCMENSLATARKNGNRTQEGFALMGLGIDYSILGHYPQALDTLGQALAVARETGPRRVEIMILKRIGMTLRRTGKQDESLSSLEQAFRLSRETADPGMQCQVLAEIGYTLMAKKEYVKSEKTFEESLRLCAESGFKQGLVWAYAGLGLVFVKQGKPEDSVAAFEKALDIQETRRDSISGEESRMSIMHHSLWVYDELIKVLFSLDQSNPGQGFDRKALEVFERKQGRVFLEEMGKSGAKQFSGVPASVKSKENELQESLNNAETNLTNFAFKSGGVERKKQDSAQMQALAEQVNAAIANSERFQEELRVKYPKYHQLKNPKPASTLDLQKNVLKEDEAIITYNVTNTDVFIFVLSSKCMLFKRIKISCNELSTAIYDFRQPTANMNMSKAAYNLMLERGQKLYATLIPEDIRESFAGCKMLYIVPTGSLYDLPFETLVVSLGLQSPEFLIQRHAVAYLSSASLLKVLRDSTDDKSEKGRQPYTAFANPVYGTKGQEQGLRALAITRNNRSDSLSGRVPELPETEDEVRAIAKIFGAPANDETLQLRGKASRSNVLRMSSEGTLKRFRYVGFACHGVLPGQINFLNQPALILSLPDPQTKGTDLLTMSDVFGLNLDADLITLTACNSGRGKDERGEGVVALTRAFMFAGSQAVAVTLWSVETESIKDLSVAFHSGLANGLGRAEALRQAKIKMLRDQEGGHNNPIFWAPLVLFGNGG